MSAPPIRIDPAQTRATLSVQYRRPLIGCRLDPTGDYVFAGSEDNSVVRWHPATRKTLPLTGHRSWVRALAFSGNLLFSGDWAGRLIAWPYADERPAPRWNSAAHKGWVRALAVSPDGRTLASCGNDKLVKLWSVPDGKLLQTLEGHDWHVYNVAFHPNGKSLVSADLHGVVHEWDLKKAAVVRTLVAKELYKYDPTFGADIGGVRSMAFDVKGTMLACAGITNVTNAFAGVGNPLVVLFDWASGKTKTLLRPRAGFNGTAWGVAIHPRGFILGVGGGNGGALWAWRPDQPLATFTLALPSNGRDLAMHPDGRRLAIPFENGYLRLYDMGPK